MNKEFDTDISVELIDLETGFDASIDDDTDEEDEQNATGVFELHPTRADLNERLDKYVAANLQDLSRSYIQQLIEDGRVMVDGKVRRQTFKMTPGEVVTVEVPPPTIDQILPEAIPIDVIYEDADILVVNKAAGMVVHPAPGHLTGTLANAVLAHAPEISVAGSNRPGIVHRLDKDTTGLIVVAKSDRARVTLIKQWNSRSVVKRYIALVHGVVAENEATINVPIGRDPVARNKMAALSGGRDAITHFSVRERFPDATLLDLQIETGRTHQIRVHLAFIGHPVAGDAVYNRYSGTTGGSSTIFKRQFLHAAGLGFVLPDGQFVEFEAPLAPDLAEGLEKLRHIRDEAAAK